MVKIPPRGPDYSGEREWRVVLEDLRSQFRVFGEGLQIVNGRLERIEMDVAELKTQVRFIQMVLPTLATKDDLIPIERRLTALEKAS